MQRFFRTLSGIAAVAGLAALIAESAPCARAQGAAAGQGGQTTATKRQYKDNGEYDLYSQAYKDVMGNAPAAKQIQDLETWAQKYPESDYKDVRTGMLVAAYSAANPPQPAKVLELAAPLMAKDLKTVFDDPADGKRQTLTFLYNVSNAAGLASSQYLPNPTPAQVELGHTAAERLKAESTQFFVAANKPAQLAEADWTKMHATLDAGADHTRLVLAIYPAEAAMAKTPKVPEECKTIAEPAYRKALADFPDNAYLSYKLAQSLSCQQKDAPEKVFQAVYEYERAAVIDPTLGGAQKDPKVVPGYADRAYVNIHGSDEGLEALKAKVKESALPPDGFKFKTSHEVADEKQQEFEKSNPELAMWMKIKGALTDPADPDYFETKLKDTAGPKLKGVVVEGACRGKEVTIAFPSPGDTGALNPEVKLKLDAALTGKPDPNTEVTFEGGVATAFSKEPFQLTMDIEKAKVEGLKVSPCTPTPATKKSTVPVAPKKK